MADRKRVIYSVISGLSSDLRLTTLTFVGDHTKWRSLVVLMQLRNTPPWDGRLARSWDQCKQAVDDDIAGKYFDDVLFVSQEMYLR